MRTIITILALLLLAVSANAESTLVPAVASPGFEEDGGWAWAVNGAKATIRTDTTGVHTGKRCIVFANESGVGPNCYARYNQIVGVLPETDYELSVWARGKGVSGEGGASHITDWGTYNLNLPTGTFGWTRVSTTFKTKPGQRGLDIGFNLINACKELAVDDVSLVPLGAKFGADGLSGSFLATNKLTGHKAPAELVIFAYSTRRGKAEVEAVVSGAGKEVFRKRAAVKPGDNLIEMQWDSGTVPYGDLECKVTVLDKGKANVAGTCKVAKVDSAISADLDKVDARMKQFNELYAKCKAKRVRLDYPTVAKTMLEQFIPLARQDVQDGEEDRARFAVKDFNRTLDESLAEMAAYLADPSAAPVARRYQTGKLSIDGLSLIGDRKTSTGKKDRGPVFLCGYGHFYGVRRDMPLWPGYGVNIIQFSEFGPSAVFPKEGEVDLKPVKTLIEALDNAAKRNVKVDFLLSPHYFPDWALEKWPQLRQGGGGFFGFCVDDAKAKEVVEKFLRIVIPMIKDKPALNSFCLSNEPGYENSRGCEGTKDMWMAFLARTHGTLKALNEAYGTSYTSFADVPYSGHQTFDDPAYYDWCIFNEERFAAWHKWEADICHELAPSVPVHAKIQMHNTLFRDIISYGVSPEMFGAVTDLNGNDCIFVDKPEPGFAAPWMVQDVCYDIQRSLNLKPIFNSENHPTIDGDRKYVAPEHFRTCLWLGALRGQSATTFWVWERMQPNKAWSFPFLGNVMDRPGCAQAVGVTCLDLNRFADEMRELQHAKSPVGILFSVASIAKNRDYLWNMENAYRALNFSGIKVDFISEKQLSLGQGKQYNKQYKMIILPDAINVTDATVAALKKMPESVKLVCIGESLSKDPYNRARATADVDAIRARSMIFRTFEDAETVMCPALTAELEKLGGLPEIQLIDVATGKPAWGVEWQPVKMGSRTVISLVNLRTDDKQIRLMMGGKEIEARDLLSIGGKETVRTLKSLTPVLAEVKQ